MIHKLLKIKGTKYSSFTKQSEQMRKNISLKEKGEIIFLNIFYFKTPYKIFIHRHLIIISPHLLLA